MKTKEQWLHEARMEVAKSMNISPSHFNTVAGYLAEKCVELEQEATKWEAETKRLSDIMMKELRRDIAELNSQGLCDEVSAAFTKMGRQDQ